MGGIFLVRRFLAGDPHHFLYPRKFQRRLGDGDVSLMEGIENPTQQRQGIRFLLGVLQPGSPCRKPWFVAWILFSAAIETPWGAVVQSAVMNSCVFLV